MRIAVQIAAGAAGFMVLDGLWLGLLMKNFYLQHLGPIARLANGGFAPNWSAAGVVYLALGAGIALFPAARATSLASAAVYGALFGLVTYAVYDFTNLATLRHYPLQLAIVDTLWGATAAAACTVLVWSVAR